MKKLFLIIGLTAALPMFDFGCAAPSTRVVQVQTLKAVGQTVEQIITTSAIAYQRGDITAAQAREINKLADTKFWPAYRLAVVAVKSDLGTNAPTELVLLSAQLADLLLQYQHSSK